MSILSDSSLINSSCSDASSLYNEDDFYDDEFLQNYFEAIDSIVKKSKNYIELNDNNFYSSLPASISISNYIKRILKYTKIDESTLIISFIYFDKFFYLTQFNINDNNIHRILFSAVLVAIKYNEDHLKNFKFYSCLSGCDEIELKNIELQFIQLMNFSF